MSIGYKYLTKSNNKCSVFSSLNHPYYASDTFQNEIKSNLSVCQKKVIRIPFGGFKDNDTVITIKCQKFNLHKM